MNHRLAHLARTLAFGIFFGWLLASCAPGTDGVVLAATNPQDTGQLPSFDGPIRVELPDIPAIALPDLSDLSEYNGLLEERVGGLELEPVEGVEFIVNECVTGEAVVLQGDESLFDSEELIGESFSFSIDEATGATSYFRDLDGVRTSVNTERDGSGTFIEEGLYRRLSIEASADGSGRYYSEGPASVGGDIIKAVEVDAAGSGVYYRQHDESLTTVTLGSDGSGSLYAESPDQLLTIDAREDGTRDLYFKQGERVITLRVRLDRSWELSDTAFRDSLDIKVFPDGSGSYRQRGVQGTLSLDFDETGASSWLGETGPQIVLPAHPEFVVADRFPSLGTLASIKPPCTATTVLRFDSQVLFRVNEADVLPEAAAVLAEITPALIEAGVPLEINGHTDATGGDAYNQVLSEQRAQAVADELASLGVDMELLVNGLGETQPVAENYNADGSDNDAGQSQNRRVEIVIRG